VGTRTLRNSRRLWRGRFVAAIVVLAARFAAAQGAPGSRDDVRTSLVVLRAPSCAFASGDVDRFVQLLAIELATARVQLIRDVPALDAELTVEVDASVCTLETGKVEVSFVRAAGGRAQHTIALQDVEPRARPRALALAVAELVRSARNSGEAMPGESVLKEGVTTGSRGEAAVGAPKEKAAPQAPPAPAPSPIAEGLGAPGGGRDEPWQGDIEASFASQIFAPEGTVGSGAGLGIGMRLRPAWLYARADAAARWTSIDDRLGSIDLSVYSAGVSLVATTGRCPELSVGPHAELGMARAAGSANDGTVHESAQTHAIALISLTGAARFWIGRWAPLIELDVGTAVARADVYVDDRRVAVVGGAFVGVRAGVGFGY